MDSMEGRIAGGILRSSVLSKPLLWERACQVDWGRWPDRPLKSAVHWGSRFKRAMFPMFTSLLLAVSGSIMPVSAATPVGTVIGNTAQAGFTINGGPVAISQPSNTVQLTVAAPVVAVRTKAVIEFLRLDPATATPQPTTTYNIGDLVNILLTDGDQNIDPLVAETVQITLTDSVTGDVETLTATETGPNTGIFMVQLNSTSAVALPQNNLISTAKNSQLSASYTDPVDGTDTAAVAALVIVDPFGLVFDAKTGQPVSGVSVTLIDAATGLPATVLGDDGVSIYPSTVISGTSTTDSGGNVYNFAPGVYRFPLVSPGSYQLKVAPPTTYAFPSAQTNAAIQALPGAPFVITVGSRGEVFLIDPGPAVQIDLPLDPKFANIFVTKLAGKSQVAVGDVVPYQVTIENPNATIDVASVTVTDQLPVGFRYLPGSTKLDGAPFADPVIAPDGRGLTFTLGLLPAGTTRALTYHTRVGVNVQKGEAVNSAVAAGVLFGNTAVASNLAKTSVVIIEDLYQSKGFLAGRVFIDENMNAFNDEDEAGIKGVRIFLEDGTFAVSDGEGEFHFEGLSRRSHLVQLDLETVPDGYEVVPLPNSRFAGRGWSQFADLGPGGLWRTNFRLMRKPPEETEVRVTQSITDEAGRKKVCMVVGHKGDLELTGLQLIYLPPTGWQAYPESATVDGIQQAPQQELTGLEWTLDAAVKEQLVCMGLTPGGDAGEKASVAYARFAAEQPVERKGRTELAMIRLHEELDSEQVEINLYLHFDTLSAIVADDDVKSLEEVVKTLLGASLERIRVTGHTDNVRIRPENRKYFADNQALSEARARSVSEFLGRFLKTEFEVVGMADRQPIASNKTTAGRKKNRRVTLQVSGQRVRERLLNLDASSASVQGRIAFDRSREKVVATPVPVPTVKALNERIKIWLQDSTQKTQWLYPEEKELPPIPSTSIVLQHPDDQLPELWLGGEKVSLLNYEGMQRNKAKHAALSIWRGVDLKEGDNHFRIVLKGRGGELADSLERTVHYSSPPVRAEWVEEQSDLVADGKRIPVIAIRFSDAEGQPAREGIQGYFRIDPPYRAEENPKALDTIRTEQGFPYRVGPDGIALIRLMPTSSSGEAVLHLPLANREKEIRVWLEPEMRDWILVGFGEGSVGFNTLRGQAQPISKASEKEGLYKDGRSAFYAKGKVLGKFLLTAAYDTAKTKGEVGRSLHQTIDPGTYYTVYGDTSEQQYDAASSSKLYLKLERKTFYALFGDYDTGLTVTELSRHSRTLNGLKSEYRGKQFGYSAFAARSSQSMNKDEIRGDGTSGLYRLNRNTIIANSETVRIETRDRFRSHQVLESVVLSRHLDYDIDYTAGTIYFKQPVPSKSVDLNPIYIIVEYESNDSKDQFAHFGGRGSAKALDDRLEVGGTFIQKGQRTGKERLTGADLTLQLTENSEMKAEVAQSDTFSAGKARAYKAEVTHIGKQLRSQAYMRQQDDAFGLGQQQGSENATRKYGARAESKVTEKLSLRGNLDRQQMLATGAKQDQASLQANYTMSRGSLHAGGRVADNRDGTGSRRSSKQMTAGATLRATDRISLRADREQNLGGGANSVDYPNRTVIGADLRLTHTTTLSATQEWTQGAAQNSQSTRVGVRAQPWNGSRLSLGYEEQLSEAGARSFANAGLLQSWQAGEFWSFDAGVDRTQTLRHPGALPLNNNVPLASGGGEDFTAVSLGMNYRPEGWVWNNRLEYRLGSLSRKYGLTSGVAGDPLDGLTSMLNLQWLREHNSQIRSKSDQGTATVGLAWRPSYDGWMFFNRLELQYQLQQTATEAQKNWRYIDNFHSNWQINAQNQLALQLGAKWSREQIDLSSYSGFTGLAGIRYTHDITEKWDVSYQATARFMPGQWLPSAGLSIGFNLFENLWVSAGYNFVGFYDRDFSGGNHMRQGAILNFRFKFDQHDTPWLNSREAQLLRSRP